ncbi:hypothetical protein QUF80_11485 [Desulfococcaceae bacterium HSG8]|nr:hypothetical protein [Desulfococcaceae bacterium HSG8]
MKLELYKAAKYYYWPGWHEPGALSDCFVNKKIYEDLPADLREIIRQAASAAYYRLWSEYSANNGVALLELVNRHKVQLRRFPDRLLMELARLSQEVMEEIAARDPLSKKMYDAIRGFRNQSVGWTQISEEAYSLARSLVYSYLP